MKCRVCLTKSLTADQEDISGDMESLLMKHPNKRLQVTKSKDTKLSEGSLSAEVNNVLFGEKGKVEGKGCKG